MNNVIISSNENTKTNRICDPCVLVLMLTLTFQPDHQRRLQAASASW